MSRTLARQETGFYRVAEIVGQRLTLFMATTIFLLAIILHLHFTLWDYWGEQDAARFASDIAISKLLYSQLQAIPQFAVSAPLFYLEMWLPIHANWMQLTSLPTYTAALSLVASGLVSTFLFLFCFQVTGSRATGIVVALLLQFNPDFWINSHYGFPTIIAMAFFLLAVCLFWEAIKSNKNGMKLVLFGLSYAAYLCAIGNKYDSIMLSLLFFLPVTAHCAPDWRRMIKYSVAISVAQLCAFILRRVLVSRISAFEGTSTFFKSFATTYSAGLKNLAVPMHREVILASYGRYTLLLMLVGCLILIATRRYRNALIWIILSCLPVTAWWCLLQVNSARHNLMPAILAQLLLALPLAALKGRWKALWSVALLLMVVSNYVAGRVTYESIRPSARLWASSRAFTKQQHLYKSMAIKVAGVEDPKVCLDGNGPLQPYLMFATLTRPDWKLVDVKDRANDKVYVFTQGSRNQEFYWRYRPLEKNAREDLVKEGWTIISDMRPYLK